MRATGLSQAHRKAFLTQLQQIYSRIEALEQQQKELKADASAKWKALSEAKAAFKKIQSKKTKIEISQLLQGLRIFFKTTALCQEQTMVGNSMELTAER
jgi:hypothetical protein